MTEWATERENEAAQERIALLEDVIKSQPANQRERALLRLLDAERARVAVLEAALREQHNWQLNQGTVWLEDFDGKPTISINGPLEYSESGMCERTIAALAALAAPAAPREDSAMPYRVIKMDRDIVEIELLDGVRKGHVVRFITTPPSLAYFNAPRKEGE